MLTLSINVKKKYPIPFSTLDDNQDLPKPNSSATGTLKDLILNVKKTDGDIETACVEAPGGKKMLFSVWFLFYRRIIQIL